MANLIVKHHLAMEHELAIEDIPEYPNSNPENGVVSNLKVFITSFNISTY